MEAPDDWLTLEPRGEGRNKWLKTWPDHIGLSGTQGKSSIKAYYVGMHIYLPFAVLASAPSMTCHYLCRVHFKAKKVISTCLGLFIVQIWIFCQPEYLHHLEVFFKTLHMHLWTQNTTLKSKPGRNHEVIGEIFTRSLKWMMGNYLDSPQQCARETFRAVKQSCTLCNIVLSPC